MTTETLLALVLAHKWVAVSAVVIGVIVRLSKEDATAIPLNIPAKWRPLLAVALGQVSAVLECVAAGTPWKTAVVDGVLASVVAILGHEWIVERLLGDHEIPIPGLTKSPVVVAPIVAPVVDVSEKTDPDVVVVPDDAAKKN